MAREGSPLGERLRYDGSIRVILGPMFSGKTTELIRRIRRYHVARMSVVVVKYAPDTRYSQTDVVSHDQTRWAAVPTRRLMDHLAELLPYDVIGIDEAQFFDDLVEFCEEMAARGKHVVVAGLDATYQRKPFGQLLALIPLAENVKKLKAVCSFCGSPAAYSLRTASDEGVEVIGGLDKYVAACRPCFEAHNTHPSSTSS